MAEITRRELAQTAIAAGALAGAAQTATAASGLEMRPLGKTGMKVGVLGIGTSPFGRPDVTQADVNNMVAHAAELGINYLDAAPIYRQAERRLGPALKGKRDKFVLVTKVESTSKQDATWQVEESLQKVQTDYFDLVHIHNVGRTDRFPSLDILLGEDGALQGLRDLKKKGVVKHIGMTCHLRPKRALPILNMGDIEAVMCAANFVDNHIYDFEGTVFSAAAKKGLGVVAMKILGGSVNDGPPLLLDHYERAVRYALGIPGLSVAIMGMKDIAEMDKAFNTVKAYKALKGGERMELSELGKKMAADWGEHRGPAV